MDNTTKNFFLLIGCLLILLLYLVYPQIISSKSYQSFKKWVRKDIMLFPSDDTIFQIAWDGFLLFIGVVIALYIGDSTKLVNMNINTLWIIVGFFLFLIIMSTIRRNMQPKDTRLDELLTVMNDIKRKIENLPDKETINRLNSSIQELIEEIRKNRNTIIK